MSSNEYVRMGPILNVGLVNDYFYDTIILSVDYVLM